MSNGDENISYSPEVLRRAKEIREETDRMNREIQAAAASDDPGISEGQLDTWNTMDYFQKQQAYQTGQYRPQDPMGIDHPLETRGFIPEVEGTRPVLPRDVVEQDSYEQQMQRIRRAYGSGGVVDNPNYNPNDPNSQAQVPNTEFIRSWQRFHRQERSPSRIFTPSDDERPGIDSGIVTQEETTQHFRDMADERRQRMLERRERIAQNQEDTRQMVAEGSFDMSPEDYQQWEQGVQARAEEPLTPIQEQYRMQSNYAGEIGVEDFAPGLRERDPEQWRFLVESFPRGIPIEHLSAESEVEWSLMDERHSMPVANIDHMVSVIAQSDVARQIQDKANTDLLTAQDRRRLSIDLYPAAEAQARARVNRIRQDASGKHIALFDPAGGSLGEIVEEYRASDQGYTDYFGAIADAWWQGAGSTKSSLLYTDNRSIMVEHEGLLDFGFRGVAGLFLSPITTDVEAIAEVYHGIGFERHSQEVGEALTDVFLKSMSYTPTGLVAGAVMGESIADVEEVDVAGVRLFDRQFAVDQIADNWAVGMTIASPDLFTVATAGLGAAYRVPKATGSAYRAASVERVVQAAEQVTAAQRSRAVATTAGEAFVNGWKGNNDAALADALSRYLAQEERAVDAALQAVRRDGDLATDAGRQLVARQEIAIIAEAKDRIRKVAGTPLRDIIEVQHIASIGGSGGVVKPVANSIANAVAAESRLAQGVAPVRWDALNKANLSAAQASRRAQQGKPGGAWQVVQTEKVIEGGMVGKRGAARKEVKLGKASENVPVAMQEEAISMVKSAVDSGKFVFQGLKGNINPTTGKLWTPDEIEVIAKLELRATEAADIAHSAYLAELKARVKLQETFSTGGTATKAEVDKLATKAKGALAALHDLRTKLVRWDVSKPLGSNIKYKKLQKKVEAARKAADNALLEYGNAAGKASKDVLRARLKAQAVESARVKRHLVRLARSIKSSLAGKGGKSAKAGLHNAKSHSIRVKDATDTAKRAYAVPSYRKFTNILRQASEAHKGVATAWRSDAWNNVPTYKQVVSVLTNKGILKKGATEIDPADLPRLQETLENFFPKAVLEHIALSNAPEAVSLRKILGAKGTPVSARTPVPINDVINNINTLVRESRAIQMSSQRGAIFSAASLQRQDLMLHNPGMLSDGVSNALSSSKWVRAIQGTVNSFMKPWLSKVGWGNAEVVELMKGVENFRRYHGRRLTYAATSGKLENRSAAIDKVLTDTVWSGESLFKDGFSLIKAALKGSKNNKGEMVYANPELAKSVEKIIQTITNAYFRTGGYYGADKIAAIRNVLRADIEAGKINSWDTLKRAMSRAAGSQNVTTPRTTEFILRSEAILAQGIVTAAALNNGFKRAGSLAAHVSDEGLKGLASLLKPGQRDIALRKMGLKGLNEALEVAARLGVPPTLVKAQSTAGKALVNGLLVVEKDGGVTFLNQRLVDSIVDSLEGVIKDGSKYYREEAPGLAQTLHGELQQFWRLIYRQMTTGAFHLGYFSNMVYGNVSQAFAEAGLGAAAAVASSSALSTTSAALLKMPVLGPKLEAKYAKLTSLTLPDPSLAMFDARSNALLNTRMLDNSVEMTLPGGQKMKVGEYRRELQEQGVFTSLSSHIAPQQMLRDNRKGALSRMVNLITGGRVKTDIKPSKLVTYPMEQTTRMFDHLEILQRMSLYNYLRLNKGYSKQRAGTVMRNSLYDWNFAATDSDTWMSGLIMFYNFHKLSIGRAMAHLTQPAVSFAKGGSKSFINNILRTSPLHPDAFASARINAYSRVHQEYIERPGLEEAGVGTPGWSTLTKRGFVGGGQLTEDERIAIQNVTGRNATEFVLSTPAPTPEGALETLYGLIFTGLRAFAPDSGVGFEDLGTLALKELAARATPPVKSVLGSIIEDKPLVQEYGKLKSPLERVTAQIMRSAFPGLAEFPDIEDSAGVQFRGDTRMTMRVGWKEKTLYNLILMDMRRKIDPIIESGALDHTAEEALKYWFFQNLGYRKTHFTNPRSEAGYRVSRIERGAQDAASEFTNIFPGGVEPEGVGLNRGPSLETQMLQDEIDARPRYRPQDPRANRLRVPTPEEAEANRARARAFRRLAESE